MGPILQHYFSAHPAAAVLGFGLLLLFTLLTSVPITCGILYSFYYLLTLPMRRNQRVRHFLDLLEMGLRNGRTAEAAVVEIAACGDSALGKHVPRLVPHLTGGLKLSQGLERVPAAAPPQIRNMLKAGEQVGDITKVIPACRQLLRDGVSQVRGALNYLIILTTCVTPVAVFIPLIISVKIMPKLKEIFAGYNVGTMPALSRFLFARNGTFVIAELLVLCLLWLVVLAYLFGPRLQNWLQKHWPALPGWFQYRLPWRRKRLQRDFSSMLAVLLDANVPEPEAVTLAAESTGNHTVVARAARARALLSSGVKLPDALRVMDDAAELQWRLSNALRGRGGFGRALGGWHEALDARAFQLEQAAAQTATTALVLFNGLIVAGIVIGVFLMIISLLNQALLW